MSSARPRARTAGIPTVVPENSCTLEARRVATYRPWLLHSLRLSSFASDSIKRGSTATPNGSEKSLRTIFGMKEWQTWCEEAIQRSMVALVGSGLVGE